jgi:hypothetical protein
MRRRKILRRNITSGELTRALDASYRHIVFAHAAAEEDQLQRELDDIAARSMKIKSQKPGCLAQRGTLSSDDEHFLRWGLVQLGLIALMAGSDLALRNASVRPVLYAVAHWAVLFGVIPLFGVVTVGLLLRIIVIALTSFRARQGRMPRLGEFLTTFRARRHSEN